MEWLFTLGIIVLAVYHPGFRRVLFWSSGIAGAFMVLVMISMVIRG